VDGGRVERDVYFPSLFFYFA
jgi:hypothetical protein